MHRKHDTVVVKFEPQATKKFFGAAVFQKCCRGVDEQPTGRQKQGWNPLLPDGKDRFP